MPGWSWSQKTHAGGGARVEREATGGARRTSVGKRFGEQPRGVCPRIKPGATWDKHFRRGGHRTQRVWPGEGCGAREACSP